LSEGSLEVWLVKGLAGDGVAYRRFLDGLSAHLRSYLRRRLTSSPDVVEDLLQEVLLAIHNQRHTYNRAQPLTPWVQAIARYKLVDLHQRRARNESLQDPLDDDNPLFGVLDHEASETRHDLAKLLSLLPDRQRLPILYVKIDGASVRDAARHIGMSESAVKAGIYRGLKALAERMRSVA
jgi:RNA polymerase sigma-70 factor (ECF subfamily)